MVDVLGRLVDKAKAMNEFRGLKVGRYKVEVSHIQYADDTLFFIERESYVVFVGDFEFILPNVGIKDQF